MSASPENIKQWKFPDGNFLQNLSGHQAIVNTLAVNTDGVLVSGGITMCTLVLSHIFAITCNMQFHIHVLYRSKESKYGQCYTL